MLYLNIIIIIMKNMPFMNICFNIIVRSIQSRLLFINGAFAYKVMVMVLNVEIEVHILKYKMFCLRIIIIIKNYTLLVLQEFICCYITKSSKMGMYLDFTYC